MNALKKSLHFSFTFIALAVANVSAAEQFSGNVALVSDYAFRGFTQTDGDAAIQGGFDVAHNNGIYAGVWASNVESDPSAPVNYSGANLEADIYAGWSKSFDQFSLDVGVLRYQYPDTSIDENNTDEYHIGAEYDFQFASAALTLHYSPDYFGAEKAVYWDFTGEVPLSKNLTFTAHYGATNYSDDIQGDDYNDWRFGIATEWGGFGFSLAYVDISGVAAGCDSNTCDGRTIVGISRSL